MRKFFVFGIAAALALGMLTSCGDPIPSETPLSVEDVLIAGEGSQYLAVAAGEYTLKQIDKKTVGITVKVEAAQTLDRGAFIAAREDAEPEGKIGFDNISLILTDKDGAALDSYISLSPDSQGRTKLRDLLAGNYDEAAVTFTALVSEKKKMGNLMGAAGFELAQADITYDKKASTGKSLFERGREGDIKGAFEDVKGALFGSDDEGGGGAAELEGTWVDIASGTSIIFEGKKLTLGNVNDPFSAETYTFTINTRKKTMKLTDQFGDTEEIKYSLNGNSLGIKDEDGSVLTLLRL